MLDGPIVGKVWLSIFLYIKSNKSSCNIMMWPPYTWCCHLVRNMCTTSNPSCFRLSNINNVLSPRYFYTNINIQSTDPTVDILWHIASNSGTSYWSFKTSLKKTHVNPAKNTMSSMWTSGYYSRWRRVQPKACLLWWRMCV